MTEKPMVSIILPVFNAEKYIKETLLSILNQTYTDFELIIINDASEDRSMDIADSVCQEMKNVKYINLPRNSGVSAARNAGIDSAEGRYIAFIDSDDLWKSDKLEKQISFMQNNGYRFSFSSYEIMHCGENRANSLIHVPRMVDHSFLLTGNSVPCFTVICEKNLLGNHRFKSIGHEDYVLWLEISKESVLYGLDDDLGIYRKHSNSISANKLKAAFWVWNIYRNVEKMGVLKSAVCFVQYAVKGVIKHSR